MAVKVKSYYLEPTALIPNSPYPLLHYPGLLFSLVNSPNFKTTNIFDLFASNGWQSQWIARYGPDIQSHYHSTTHECMAVISGSGATIRFGVADSKTWDHGRFGIGERADGEEGGLELQAALGDVFIIPAGVAHKTFAPRPSTSTLAFHQPEDIKEGRAREVTEEKESERRAFYADVPVEGEFMMMGAYVKLSLFRNYTGEVVQLTDIFCGFTLTLYHHLRYPYGSVWDFAIGGEHDGKEEDVWSVPKPGKDPVLGISKEGLLGLWADRGIGT